MNASEQRNLKDPLLINDKQEDLKNEQLAKKQSKSNKDESYPPVPFLKLYRFATPKERFLLCIAGVLSMCAGAAFPAFALIWGNTANAFSPANIGGGSLNSIVGKNSLYIGGIGLLSMLIFFAISSINKYVGQRQGTRLRTEYLRSIIRQDMGFFDKIDPAELSSRVEEDCKTIIEGTEDKLITFLSGMFTFIGGFAVAFYRGWQLTLILICLTPFQGVAGFIYGRFVAKAVERNAGAYAKAGAIAEQALSSIRTVVGLAGEEKECKRYTEELETTQKTMIKYGLIQGLSIGFFSMFTYIFYAFSYYFGSVFIEKGVYDDGSHRNYTGGDVLSVYFAIISGASALSATAPSLKAFAAAKQTAARVFSIIDKRPKIDAEDPSGRTLPKFDAKITFDDVTFSYPSNPDKAVLKNINFEIAPGKKTAIVGESGSGKSTIVQLIERLYDPQAGSVKLDGVDLKDLNLKWLRQNISYVGQEPVLFTGTIRENLALAKDRVSQEEIIDALKKANAYDFVMKLEKKIDTYVGVGGIQLSGGQKQRIAIARAILRNTKILLLDEATSALDRKNERTIQETLDNISKGLTTVIIAHRLSTIRNADEIIVLNNGAIEERGTHAELVNKQGLYYKLELGQLNLEDLKAIDGNKSSESESDDLEEPLEFAKEKENTGQNEITVGVQDGVGDISGLKRQASDTPGQLPLLRLTSRKSSRKSTKDVVPVTQEATKPATPAAPKLKTTQALFRLFTFSKPERPLFIASLCMSLLLGALGPSVAILTSNILFVLLAPDAPDFRSQANFLSLMFLILAFIMFILNLFQFWLFAILAERLTNRVRTRVFNKFLRMHMAWHDQTENAAGILSTTLATDAANVSSLTSTVIGLAFQAVSALTTGITIAFVASWHIAVASVLMVPLILILGRLSSKVTSKLRAQTDEIKHSGQIVSEVINNIRTVACLGQEHTFKDRYETLLKTIEGRMIRLGTIQGLFFGANQLAVFLYFAVTFYVGSQATSGLGLNPKDVFIAIFGVIFAIFNVAGALRYLPDVSKANDSAQVLFKYMDMESEIDINDPNLKYRDPIRGFIEFRDVAFKYPSRENEVFKGLNFNVNAGQKVALVGPSGCGKSTTVQLLLRFYDVTQGEILIDGVNIKNFDLKHLRKSFGFVSQEPVLFNGTIESNIKYSKEDARFDEVKDAAKRANALDFIEKNDFQVMNEGKLPDAALGTGFQRLVGPKGTQLSGGQKQRIAIARAILNKPSVLLLDEATSALDSQNEAIVQESLDQVTEGVTSVTVAHRFSTIKNSDEILVFKDGQIVERGTYEHLNEIKGFFYQLERGLD